MLNNKIKNKEIKAIFNIKLLRKLDENFFRVFSNVNVNVVTK
jgi:hypothetical protein